MQKFPCNAFAYACNRSPDFYRPQTGQQWVFPITELAADVEKMRQQRPEQGDLFPADDKKAGEGGLA